MASLTPRPTVLLRALRRRAQPIPRCTAVISRTLCRVESSRSLTRPSQSSFHTSSGLQRRFVGHNNETVPDQPPPTDFEQMDVLGATPVPSTSVDVCMWDGFQLNNGTKVLDGQGVVLVGGEAFAWQPWGKGGKRLVNARGQWEVPPEAFGLFSLVWPRPGLLIIGQGPEIRPLSPETKRYISSLGMLVEVLDTRNAASQFNMLATERGVSEVAAAMVPIGWREGVGVQ